MCSAHLMFTLLAKNPQSPGGEADGNTLPGREVGGHCCLMVKAGFPAFSAEGLRSVLKELAGVRQF